MRGVDFFYSELYPGRGKDSVSNTCMVLEFKMTARSDIGESAEKTATGGFPVGMYHAFTRNETLSVL